jgi:hypothetical protein
MSYYDPDDFNREQQLAFLNTCLKVMLWVTLIVALFQGLTAHTDASTTYRITSGMISATPEELEKCQFGLANDTALLFRPGSIPCALMKTLHGRKVDLWFTIVE